MSLTDQTPVEARRSTAVPPGTRLAVVGLAFAAIGPLVVVAADPASAPFVLPVVALPAIAAPLAWHFGTWAKALAAVIGAALIVSLVIGPSGAGLAHPTSVFDFVPSATFLVGGIAALGGAVAAIRHRYTPSTTSTRGEHVAIVGALTLVLVTTAISTALTLTTRTTVAASVRAGAIEVVVDDAGYTDPRLSLPAGEPVRLLLRNEGRIVHTVTSDVLGIDQAITPGSEVLVEANVPAQPQAAQFWCVPHSAITDDGGRAGMVGDLVISS